MLPFLGLQAKSYDVGDLNKIIIKSLPPKAMEKYVGDEGDELNNMSDILNLMSTIEGSQSLRRRKAAEAKVESTIKQ